MNGQQIIWGAPVYDTVRIGWTETRKAAGAVATFHETRMEASFPNEGRIIYRSLDNPDNARGHTADGIVMDEAPLVNPDAWDEVLRPMLLDTRGWAWFMGTPLGHNWFFDAYYRALDDPRCMCWHAPTLGAEIVDGRLIRKPHPLENPDMSFDELLNIFETTPERTFRQEYLAEFLDSGGGVFRKVRQAATAEHQDGAVTITDANGKVIGQHEYLIGVDWAKSADFTSISVVDNTLGHEVHLSRFNQIDYEVQIGRLRAICERFHPLKVITERNNIGEPLLEQLDRMGLPVYGFTTTNASKQQAIDGLALSFEREEIKILNDPVHIAELEAYEMQQSALGMWRFNAPRGGHDDTVMSLALAWWGRTNARPGLVRVADNIFY